MILLGFESVEEDGVVVYPDHANPYQYWYIPANIHLAQRDGNVIFTLIKYRPDPQKPGTSGGGFLTCEVNLSLDEDLKNRLTKEILHTFKNKGVTKDNLTLSPVLYDLGKVGVSALNVEQDNIWTASSPSLSGNNTAILSLTLDQNQATLLDAAYKDEGKPVGVSYQLEFTAMRPALEVEVTADYKAIKDAFQTKFSASIPLDQAGITRFRLDFESQLQWLREQNALIIHVLNYSTDQDRNEREKWALDFVKEQLLRDFFVRKLNDMPDFPAAGDPKFEELMDKLANNMAAQNKAKDAAPKEDAPSAPLLSPVELGSLQFRYNRQDEARTFTFLYNESKVVKQFNFPQSFFGTLLKNVSKDQPYFIEIDLNDPFFKTIDISVQAPLDSYGDIELTSAQVVLKYDGDQRDFYFDSQKPGEQKAKFNVNQAVGTAYQYQVQYNFKSKNASGWSGSASYKDSEWHTTEARTLTLLPQEQITFLNVAVSLKDGFEWDGINATKVYLTPVDSKETETLMFTKNNSATQRWKMRVLKPDASYYTYRVEYVMDGNSNMAGETKTINASSLLVSDPPNTLKVSLMPIGIDWNVVTVVEVNLKYEDPVNGINNSSNAFVFESQTNTEYWSVRLANPNATKYKWKATYYMKDGSEKAHPTGGAWEERSGSVVLLKNYVPKS